MLIHRVSADRYTYTILAVERVFCRPLTRFASSTGYSER